MKKNASFGDKKFYWLKLNRDFFKRHDIKVIEGMENGKDYVLFYLKLLVESIDHLGELRFSDTIPYNEKMLSALTDTNIDIVRGALSVLSSLGLVEILSDQTLYMSQIENMIGQKSQWAIYKANQRSKEKLELDDTFDDDSWTMSNKCPTDVQQEIRDIEIRDIEYRDTYAQKIEQDEPKKPKSILSKEQQERFDIFWEAYPRRIAKQNAIKAWNKIKPNQELLDKILKSLEVGKKSNDWTKDNGQFIPHPATWLNRGGWEDEYQEVTEVRKKITSGLIMEDDFRDEW